MASAPTHEGGGIEALHRLKSAEPPLYLSPSPDLSESARLASRYLFSSLRPFIPKSPIDQLLVDGFDAEQIWQQIDIQAHPLISTLRRQVKHFENNPDEISNLFGDTKKERKTQLKSESDDFVALDNDTEGFDFGDDLEEEDEDEEESGESENEEDPDEDEGGEEEEGGVGVEDRFLKIKELEDYLEEDEAREYGLKRKKKTGDGEIPKGNESSDEDDFDEGEGLNEGEDDDEEEDDDDDKLGLFGDGLDDEGDDELGNVRYEDFFVPQKKNVQKKKSKPVHDSDDLNTDDEQEDEEEDAKLLDIPKQNLSTHEKELKKKRSEIEQMERDNLGPRVWTMQGEVTAAKRPKNSALEVDLDFEHNVRPAPVITEEVTASLEELIKKRILEGRFDDVQRAPTLLSKAPKEIKEMDEKKSNKGLADLYEDDYSKKAGFVSEALSFSDEQKKEATLLFKKICFKLDALSHFHFTPKPVIEDMSIQVNVPALAMEEIAPLVTSDANMLAPEEVFGGKGDIKEEAELTQEERRRRRANKKRKYKAVAENVTAAKKARDNALQDQNHVNGKIES